MKNKRLLMILLGSCLLLLVIFLVFVMRGQKTNSNIETSQVAEETTGEASTEAPTADSFLTGTEITQKLLPLNQYSRPGTALETINGVVVHYVGNPGTSAAANWEYFDSLAKTGETSASSHYIIGLQGEILQCVPLNEVAYCSNQRNWDTISIECCHPTEDGKFNHATYQSLVRLCAALCRTYGLDPRVDVIRHYDVTQKECPRYFVQHEDEWEVFRLDVYNEMKNN